MTRLEKLKTLEKAYYALIPCIANNAVGNLGLILNDAPQILRELLDEEAADAIAKERDATAPSPRPAHIHTATINISVDTSMPFEAEGGTNITFSADPEPRGDYTAKEFPACAFAAAIVKSVELLGNAETPENEN